MLDHLGIRVSDFKKCKAFYEETLATLNITPLMGEEDLYCGFGDENPFFWMSKPDDTNPVSRSVHIAFGADSKEAVDRFYKAALEAGALDNGAPGYRPQYHPGFYGAFVFDLDGNNVEAVFHDPNPPTPETTTPIQPA